MSGRTCEHLTPHKVGGICVAFFYANFACIKDETASSVAHMMRSHAAFTRHSCASLFAGKTCEDVSQDDNDDDNVASVAYAANA